MINNFLFNWFFLFFEKIASGPSGDALQQENGDYLLLETGDNILLE